MAGDEFAFMIAVKSHSLLGTYFNQYLYSKDVLSSVTLMPNDHHQWPGATRILNGIVEIYRH